VNRRGRPLGDQTPCPSQRLSACRPQGVRPPALRWYQLAVIVLGLALAGVTALALYLTVNHSTAASETVHSGPITEQPCWQSQVPC
jgi:hypothetical protein